MNRREFIKNMAVGGLILNIPPRLLAQIQGNPDLALIQGESPSQITKEAIAALGGIDRFVSKGDLVVIKPNIGWDRSPEQAACTNPEVVRALGAEAQSLLETLNDPVTVLERLGRVF